MHAAARPIVVTLSLAFLTSAPVAFAGEQLTMPKFPAGWVEAFSRKGDQEMVEYVPPGQSATDWKEKITLEIYHDLKNLPLDTLQRRAAEQNRNACTGVVEGKFQSGVNNGYASAFWTLGCERDKISGFGETRYTKIMQGAGGLYVLSEIWRTPPYGKQGPAISPQEIQSAMDFLTSSIICDPDGKQNACPK
jgi:hypothetical protein